MLTALIVGVSIQLLASAEDVPALELGPGD